MLLVQVSENPQPVSKDSLTPLPSTIPSPDMHSIASRSFVSRKILAESPSTTRHHNPQNASETPKAVSGHRQNPASQPDLLGTGLYGYTLSMLLHLQMPTHNRSAQLCGAAQGADGFAPEPCRNFPGH